MSASAWLYKHPWINITMKKIINKPITLMTHIVCESKLHSVVRSSMHPCQETEWQSGVWLCIMPGLPMHLVQELDVDTVGTAG